MSPDCASHPRCIVQLTALLLALAPGMPATATQAAPRDGQHDFDFAHGKWKIKVRRLKAPLTGSKELSLIHI